jgi:hypothetical protein
MAAAQLPQQPARLVIKSNPEGATITIDGKTMSQKTNATFVVSPGTHYVSINSAGGNPTCPKRDYVVEPGQTLEVHCP